MLQTLTFRAKIFSCAVLGFLASPNTFAAGAEVTAVLSNSNTSVGQMVQLQVKVTGSTSVRAPGEIAVDGLDIRFAGQSQLLEGRNFQFTYSYIYNYTIMPLKAGTFKIPPLTVQAGGSALRTPELTLQVAADSPNSAQAPRSKSTAPVDPAKIAFVELTLSKTTAYVGEMIPAVVRMGFNVRTPVESLGNPPPRSRARDSPPKKCASRGRSSSKSAAGPTRSSPSRPRSPQREVERLRLVRSR